MAAETNTIITTDLEPAISIDHVDKLVTGIESLRNILGITDMIPMAEGNTIKIWKYNQKNTPTQAAEGETVKLTEFERKLVKTHTLGLKKFRKQTTAEAIQKVGRDKAINDTDALLEKSVQRGVKADFFTMLGTSGFSTTTPTANGLQAALAAIWGDMAVKFEDIDATPIYFVHPLDISKYLETAQVTVQTAFGFKYIEDFLGLGMVIIDASVPQGKVKATARENLNGAYIPAGGAVGQAFGLVADETGLVGMKHFLIDETVCVNTLILSGVLFYPEDISGVFEATIKTSAS